MSDDKKKDDKPKKEKFVTARELSVQHTGAYKPDFENVVEAPQRVVLSSMALQKRGKTTWAYTMPKEKKGKLEGLAYFQFDANYEHALRKSREQYGDKAIQHLRYAADPRSDIKTSNLAVWTRLLRDYEYCLGRFRSIVIDTTTEVLDVRKLAEYGRNTQIQQMNYGAMYSDLRWMVKQALDSDTNVNFIHRMKKEYINNNWTGEYALEGWGNIVFETQCHISHDRDSDGVFTTTIVDSGQDAMLNGLTFSSEDGDNDFKSLAMKIYPDSEEGDWL